MSKKNIYEKIISLYNTNINEGRIFMYENIGLLLRKNPLLRVDFNTFTKDDIYSECFMIADKLMLRNDIDDKKKVSRLWFLFNKWWWPLYDLLNKYNMESYTMDDLKENSNFMCDIDDDDLFEYILVHNDVLSPIEVKVLQYMQQWRGRYEIARLLQTTYHNVKDIIDNMQTKIKEFLNKINEENASE